MTKLESDTHKEKMRSYSSIFSSTSFSKLLKNEDYNFINNKIERYDRIKIGKQFITYSDYIGYVYNALRKDYRCEYIYKNELINEFILKQYGTKNTVVINEFKVGNSVADIVLFNGTSRAFEIKSELDSEKRLNQQLSSYTKIFKECYIVTHESLIEKYLNINSNIGVIAIIKYGKSFKMEEIRKACITEEIDPNILIRSLRTNEYKNIITSYFGGLPNVNNFQMFEECASLMKEIPNEELNCLFINELKNRKSNTQLLKTFYKEIRQLCLSLKISQTEYAVLNTKLCQPIKL